MFKILHLSDCGLKNLPYGGINPKTAPQVIQAGANFLASGSAVFNSDNIEETIKKLKSYQ